MKDAFIGPVREKKSARQNAPTGAKARVDFRSFTRPIRLRSGQAAEAPLFHGAARIWSFHSLQSGAFWISGTTEFPISQLLEVLGLSAHELQYAFEVVGLGEKIDEMDLLHAIACSLQRDKVAGQG
jgi:hypothetical protein